MQQKSNEINTAQQELQSDHQTDHHSDHSIGGSDIDHQTVECHDDQLVRPDGQCVPISLHASDRPAPDPEHPAPDPEQSVDLHNKESATTTSSTNDYEVLVFQGAPSLGTTTQEETQQQVQGILSQMEILSGHLENHRVRQLLLPHISESLGQLVSQCELLTNADVVQVTEQSDKADEEKQT